ncbi:thiamine phosphate synthase [Helicobacter sp. 10-6591]|uniref:thiamine phosphate synthase n=1 Tax=Helicobacter sp. 10-6591 TaxID=2004998 RepID=UPI000DCC29EF|nr:thiamine phosphate synthase [Helicobacter sp. 10-6591]RAX56318.1 hypothetical protein CCY97_00485 [Helicobacter sp. 10-6591]
MKNSLLHGIYGISDEVLTPFSSIREQLQEAIDGGVKIFQLRDKNSSDEDIIEDIYHLNDICAKNNILFVLNDRVEMAINLKLPSLHLGVHGIKDKPSVPTKTHNNKAHYLEEFAAVRARFSGILGASSYGDIMLACELEKLGADYVAFGSVFPSTTKPNAACIEREILAQAKKTLKIPICAIGGISKYNISLLKNADMCAVVKSLWIGNPKENASMLLNNWNPIKPIC